MARLYAAINQPLDPPIARASPYPQFGFLESVAHVIKSAQTELT